MPTPLPAGVHCLPAEQAPFPRLTAACPPPSAAGPQPCRWPWSPWRRSSAAGSAASSLPCTCACQRRGMRVAPFNPQRRHVQQARRNTAAGAGRATSAQSSQGASHPQHRQQPGAHRSSLSSSEALMAPAACATLSSSAPLACRGGGPDVDSLVQAQRCTTRVIGLSTKCGAAKGVHAAVPCASCPPQRTSSSERFTPSRASYSFLASSCKGACSTAAQHCRHSLWQTPCHAKNAT